MEVSNLLPPLAALLLSPLMLGVINRTKAQAGGRRGPPLLQVYYDLWRLLNKGAVYSRTTTWIFRAGPIVALSAIIVSTLVMPLGSCQAALGFRGDLILFTYLLALARLSIVLGALDTGSSFEAMGASREVLFSALAEPALLLGVAAVARDTGELSLSAIHEQVSSATWSHAPLTLVLVAVALAVVFLAENCRVPIDDPNTHLELTMIHEVMVLDHSGPDFAFILYGAALKMWVLGSLIINLVLPARTGVMLVDLAIAIFALFVISIGVGIVESTIARLRMVRVPQLLVGAATLSALALVLEYGGRTVLESGGPLP
jgi:formate hydrogenlyase subunit 4